ncbi:hypothetical protein SSS_05577 [Sarcoptes scabiei]|nr:hypothetical protein SSS_05577 [Sarcoptes scabiei]
MAYDVYALLWQGFFALAMFIATFLSYLLPIIFYTKRHKRSNDLVIVPDYDDEDIQQNHHWSQIQENLNTNIDDNHKRKRNRWKYLLSYCNCISAGVFLGVCFLNLIPCVEDAFQTLYRDYPAVKNWFGSLNLAQFTVILGLFMVLLLENFLSKCLNNRPSKNVDSDQQNQPVLLLDEESSLENPNFIINNEYLEQEELLPNSNRSEENLQTNRIINRDVDRSTSQNLNESNPERIMSMIIIIIIIIWMQPLWSLETNQCFHFLF